MLKMLKNRLKAFAADEQGNVAIETVLFLPLMLTVLAATFSFHDAFRYKSLNVKAAYTISDAISRETDPIDNAYLDGMVELLEYLTRSEGPYSLRVTLVRYNAKKSKYISEWSKTRGDFDRLKTWQLRSMEERLPTLLHNERVIVVETATDYVPPFEVPGLNEESLFYNYGFTRPRFAPKIVWSNG
ncbi:hypothetical protein TRP8649_04416 [Pelagimonas phthalicica]|uniref:TadE-like protein n=1 Tax=Pelagimonas phthalicica TaxID=1037362 RepID=A0A238JIQ9_9RHOB|nr:TadE/TadG family type IV pilus assembly protein [Pelagimonas phthalicica]TDS90105.1 Flp pilus assembly protein TadG [Pelagimonas phthalicica]SMX30273.1 hypothetical protein TRP8649_04416 [Pelagimonas phthalicica]